MKIVDVVAHVLSTPLEEPFAFSQGWVGQRSAVIVEVVTAEGVTGWGESLCHGLQPPEVAASFVEFCYKPMLVGRDPFDAEVLWEELYNRTRPFGGGAAVNALSGVDIALWDAVGRSLSLPVHKLLGGGFRSELTPYATGFYRRQGEDHTEAGVREAKRHLSEGFRAVKLKVGFGVDVDIEYVGAIRQAVGPGVRIMMDANCAYDAPATRRILLGCRDAGVYFFEEPLAPEDLEGYKALRHLTDTHLAAGENLFGKADFRRWISEGALDILQPDLCSSGGFTECKKIAAIAQAWNTAVVPHVWGTGIGLAASLQFMATLPPTPLSMNPEEPMLEYDTSSHPFRQDLIGGAVRMSEGKVSIPQNPGIGVEVDRDTLERYGRRVPTSDRLSQWSGPSSLPEQRAVSERYGPPRPLPVVVVGAGACGMVAALAAARSSAHVMLLDKGENLAGDTVRSTGLIPAAGTRFQREAGVSDDTPELMARDILDKNGYESDLAMTRLLCERSAPLVEWLADETGCEMVCFTDFLYPGQSRFRMHGAREGYGKELVAQLERAIAASPDIELARKTPVTGVVWDGARVSGVETVDGIAEARAVILALNGFGGNREMVERHLGLAAANALYFGSPNNTGEGILWGMELGAATQHMGAYQGHASVAAPDGPLVTWGVVVNGAILVNREGRRFGRETVGYSEYAADVMAQSGGEAWEIFDEKVYAASRGTRLEEVIEAGKISCFGTLAELADAFSLPENSLSRTLEEVNATTRGERTDPFGREEFAGGPLEPPFYGIHVRGALFHTQGGLKVDNRARVLRRDGSHIPGLYAGGGTAVGVSGSGHKGYSSGNGLLAATVLGKIAGEAASQEPHYTRTSLQLPEGSERGRG